MISCMECEHGYIIDSDSRITDCSMFHFGEYVTEPEGVALECPFYKHDNESFGKDIKRNES